ncbi:hypothetical protein Tco_0030086 [Tanacetum coccineum]
MDLKLIGYTAPKFDEIKFPYSETLSSVNIGKLLFTHFEDPSLSLSAQSRPNDPSSAPTSSSPASSLYLDIVSSSSVAPTVETTPSTPLSTALTPPLQAHTSPLAALEILRHHQEFRLPIPIL